jgi:hypothetical protein
MRDNLAMAQPMDRTGLDGALAALGDVLAYRGEAYDLVCFKLYAAADHWPSRDRHLDDLRALRPSEADLLSAARWSMTHDPSPAFRSQLTAVLAHLGVEDADARLD